jgi:DNA-binding winged helix-turn-helix (wHTH) protein
VANTVYAFGPYVLDPSANRLVKDNEPVAIPSRQLDILVLLVTHAGELLSKDALVAAAWPGLAVTDNSLEQAISGLRRTLGGATSAAYIETAARRGYRFAAPVTRLQRKETVEALDALLAPHKAWIEGRAALETLERSQILHAREVFERVLVQVPDQAAAHVGLANACVLQFEMTRADSEPDRAALAAAAEHARDACRLDARYGEAWATLGFVLERTGNRSDALAASRMAVALEPDNWRHHLRLAYVSWGEERLRGARRALTLLPGFPLAHWLAATVHVAREALDEADRELAAAVEAAATPHRRFSSVAVHWLHGLVRLAKGDEHGALRAFEQELAHESSGHLYARECCANAWYAIGAVRLRHDDTAGAGKAFQEALVRVPLHPFARTMMASVAPAAEASALSHASIDSADHARPRPPSDPQVDALQHLLQRRDVEGACALLEAALISAPDGSACWTVPVDPMLRAHGDRRWSAVLGRLRNRAA